MPGATGPHQRFPERDLSRNLESPTDRPNADISPVMWNQEAMVFFIIVLVIIGLIAGLIARLLVPGPDPIGLLGTIVLGVVGSFVGGFVENLIEYRSVSVNSFHTTGVIGSVIGAIVILLLLRLTGHERGRPRRRRSW